MKKKNFKIIFHIDLNCFYASCEEVIDKTLKDKPVAVGNYSQGRGIITTANYVARAYGIRSAMPSHQALSLCNNLIFIEPNMALYNNYSKMFFDILKQYTENLEKASIDEGYLDMSHYVNKVDIIKLAKEIQDRILSELKLPCSIGVAPNKFLAKMASDLKKPLGITVLRKREINQYLWPLSITKMYGIGKKTYPKLIEKGIKTIGDLTLEKNKNIIHEILKKQANHFINRANGIDDEEINKDRYEKLKQIGNSRTYAYNLNTENEAIEKLDELVEIVQKRVDSKNELYKKIVFQIKYDDFSSLSRGINLNKYISNKIVLRDNIIDLFYEYYNKKPIRQLGVSVSDIINKRDHIEQLDIFTYETDSLKKKEAEINIIKNLKQKFGDSIIKKGIK